MPIKIQNDIPVKEVLEQENIFVMDEDRAVHQDIRPLQILILNLMPLKEDTELQLLRCLSNSPLQIDITFMVPASHHAKNTSISHIQKFYVTFDEIRKEYYDGMIVTGAPIELMEFEEVDYWDELCEILDWSEKHVTSTMYQCWGAQAAMYHFYGIQKRLLDHKMFGLFEHQIHKRKIPLVRGFDDVFLCPHSRHTEIPMDVLKEHPEITVLADSEEAGFFLGMADQGRKVFVQGHPEYDRLTLDKEYRRDLAKGAAIALPENYYPDNDPERKPLLRWRAVSAALYANWINYYVYQVTPYDMYGTPDFR
ncbi:MAG: homoserine O-succinyltransferase [Eubacterium sp.]|nr:homoserine O-succinyltransferase [Eubacterium sp.]